MENIEIIQLKDLDINSLNSVREDCMDYIEYKQISRLQRLSYLKNKITKIKNVEDNISFGIAKGGKLLIFWLILENKFDSEIFGIKNFKIHNILIDNQIFETKEIIQHSINYLRNLVKEMNQPVYFFLGLNLNSIKMSEQLNSLLNCGFHYIHTLITFGTNKNEYKKITNLNDNPVNIREATLDDVKIIMKLAEKSFKYSRFHLDPVIDNKKANKLLKISAKNSIIKHFVDIMFIAEYKDEVVGYYSGKKKYIEEFNLNIGEAVTSAVDENYRGLGIFTTLNSSLLSWFSENVDFAEMGTYVSNYPVHKTWTNNRFNIIRTSHQLSLFIPKNKFIRSI